MKKLLAIVVIGSFIACNDSKKDETVTELRDSSAINTTSGAPSGTMSVADSTKLLDRQLADSNSKMSPDSLK